jgi:hypothetical protein
VANTATAKNAAFIPIPVLFLVAARLTGSPTDTGQFQFTKLLQFPNFVG